MAAARTEKMIESTKVSWAKKCFMVALVAVGADAADRKSDRLYMRFGRCSNRLMASLSEGDADEQVILAGDGYWSER